MSRARHAKSTRWILIVLAIVLAVVAISVIARTASKKTAELNAVNFQIGALDENGEYIKDTGSIVTRKAHKVDDLEISLKKNALVTYKVYFFDKAEKFISADEDVQTGDYDGAIPANAVYFKIVVTPTNDAEVSLTEVARYAGMLEISFAKK